ncbi:MAG: GTPase [Streptosporangiaceae bacterium]
MPGSPRAGHGGAHARDGGPGAPPPAGGGAPAGHEPGHRAPGAHAAGQPEAAGPYVRVDARKLESALLALRHPIVSAPLTLAAPGADEARAQRRTLLSQIDDYLLPRLRQSGAPILVALVGSTGAGKSTLMNSVVGRPVSATGIRRPTTNSPVLACHPGEMHWFAENVFLPTLPRVRQQGLAMPGRDGLLVLAAAEGMPPGVALLDTPDIDSVVQAHREFAHQFLDASDLWLFMTSARRYADAAVWELLQQARDRSAALSVVLSRVPPAAASQLVAHFEAMLAANGLSETRRFIIPETLITDAQLPADVAAPVRQWLTETAAQEDRRVAVLTQTMAGVLDTFRDRIPELAGQVEQQLVARAELAALVTDAYAAGLASLDESTRNGSLVRGEVLARWQDFAGTGDLLRSLQVRHSRGGGKPRKRPLPPRARALRQALHASLEAVVAAAADKAAEQAVTSWNGHPAGRVLLADLPEPALAAEPDGWPFDDEPGGGDPFAAATAGGPAAPGPAPAAPAPAGTAASAISVLARSSPDRERRIAQVISAWQEHVRQLVQAENVTKRSIARMVSFDDESLALVLTIGVLGFGSGEVTVSEGTGAAPQAVLTSLFGAGLLRDIGTRARRDLHERISQLFDQEMERFIIILDSAGAPDEEMIAQMHQAGYVLEASR